jgi:hypothetical protein
MQSRQALGFALLLLLVVGVSGWWLWSRLARVVAPASPAARPAGGPVEPTQARSATGTPAHPAPAGYRLAGVALGEPESFAVIESPNGSTALYRLKNEVSGLGQLVRIEAERVVVSGEKDQFELWLSAAMTATPTVARAQKSPAATPPPRPGPGGTTPAPGSSGVPDRPAS